MLRLVSLSSGSCGNSVYIEAGATKLLVDAGTTFDYLGRQLEALGVKADELDAVLLTHEHSDHIRCAGTISRRFGVKVHGNVGTLDALPAVFGRADVRVFPVGTGFEIGDIEVEAVPHSHDSQSPVGFTFNYRGKKICIATDLGCVTCSVVEALSDADIIVLESNHDLKMLVHGRYPRKLKARVAGNKGHLSNDAASRTLARTASGREQKVLLAHLSRENNDPRIALGTVSRILSEAKIDSLRVGVAGRMTPSAVITA